MKRNALMAVLMTFAGIAQAGVAEQAAQMERSGAAYYVENCKGNIAAKLKENSYYDGKDVDGMLAGFSNKKLTDEFLRSVELHATVDSRSDLGMKMRAQKFADILNNPDSAARCQYLGGMFDVYGTMYEAQQNLVTDKKAQAEREYFATHANDPVTVDYSVEVKAVGGSTWQSRPAKGTVRSLTLSKYLEWEKNSAATWKGELWNANGIRNKSIVYNRCLAAMTEEWTKSFGYREARLRAPQFIDGVLPLEKVLRIVCQPG